MASLLASITSVIFFLFCVLSKWNRAQRRHDLAGLADVDHGLSQAGREQAEQLWRRLELEACLADLAPQSSHAPEPSHSSSSSEGGGSVWKESANGRCTPLREADLMADAAVAHSVAQRSDEEGAAAADHVKALWRTQAIWASPLTRAIQTALIAFQGHPTLATRYGMSLCLRLCFKVLLI
jgi:hypothetical protein